MWILKAWMPSAMALVAATASAGQYLGCLIEPDREADIGSQVIGVIESIELERGDFVRRGDIVAVLKSDVERAVVDVAQSRVDSEADIRVAEANLSFARQQLERAEDLLRKRSISRQELDQALTEAEVAEQRLAQARDQRRLAQRELELATTQLAQRTIRSPIDGVVAERYLEPGERIEEKPLVRIAKLDPLHVQVVVPVSLYGRITPGLTATVIPDLPNAAPVTAQVTLVDQVVDPASNTFRVRLELPNPDLKLPAGLRCRADFGAGLDPSDAAPLPSGTTAGGERSPDFAGTF